MADFISEILRFGGSLAAPYDTLTSRKVRYNRSEQSSIYNPDPKGTQQATLAVGLTTALTHIISTDIGETSKVAIGMCGEETSVVEYHSSIADIYEIITYDLETGEFKGSVYNTATSTGDKYKKSEKNGNSMLCALFPVFYADDEFKETYDKLKLEAKDGYPDREKAAKLMGTLNDNVYRRMKDSSNPNHIVLTPPDNKELALPLIKNAAFAAGTYDPDVVMVGNFEMLKGNTASSPAAVLKKAKFSLEDLNGKFILSPERVLTEEEKEEVRRQALDETHVVTEEGMNICYTSFITTNTRNRFRNYMVYGPAGSGKSQLSKESASGHGLPRRVFTASANTEFIDIVGTILPQGNDFSGRHAELIKKCKELGGITLENIARALGIPTLVDIHFDPADTFEELTGTPVCIETKDEEEIYFIDGKQIERNELMVRAANFWEKKMSKYFNEMLEDIKRTETKFVYTETDVVKAIEHGYVLEFQEPNVILTEGTLVGLNNVLTEGTLTLPSGRTIKRHPDSIIIFTTNVDYNGCRGMNQSVIDRCQKVYFMDTPSVEVMAERAMAASGNTNEDDVLEMAQIIKDMGDDMSVQGIDDGVCGMRSLINWATAALAENPYEAFYQTVLNKTSMDKESRESLEKRINESKFRPVKRKKRI